MDDKTKLIGIFYIIFGAMGILGLPLIYLQHWAMDMIFANLGEMGAEAQPVIELFQNLMAILVPLLMVLIFAHIIFNVIVGICFIKHKAYYTCLVTSIFTCFVFPIGTILGVFALMTLIEEDTKQLFYLNKR